MLNYDAELKRWREELKFSTPCQWNVNGLIKETKQGAFKYLQILMLGICDCPFLVVFCSSFHQVLFSKVSQKTQPVRIIRRRFMIVMKQGYVTMLDFHVFL